jgi:hypothetical protein
MKLQISHLIFQSLILVFVTLREKGSLAKSSNGLKVISSIQKKKMVKKVYGFSQIWYLTMATFDETFSSVFAVGNFSFNVQILCAYHLILMAFYYTDFFKLTSAYVEGRR